MKVAFILLFFLIALTSLGQCDSIYDNPQTPSKYTSDTKGLMDYLNKTLVPILGDCMKEDGGIIASLYMKLTIDKSGKVIEVEFIRLQASEKCKNKLREKILTMKGWSAGQMNEKNVCSKINWPISCLKWQ